MPVRKESDTKIFIYVISSEMGPVKIGLSSDVRNRLKVLQTSFPYTLSISFQERIIRSSAEFVEKKAHATLADRRMRGEWFSCPFGKKSARPKDERLIPAAEDDQSSAQRSTFRITSSSRNGCVHFQEFVFTTILSYQLQRILLSNTDSLGSLRRSTSSIVSTLPPK